MGRQGQGVGRPAVDLQKLKFVTSNTSRDLRYYVLKWFEKQSGAITVSCDDNWKVIPEDWAAAGTGQRPDSLPGSPALLFTASIRTFD
jgi:2',3'-cyclic-nucleotide 2'-phosphodiesterase / 3'-nucleotidase